MSLREGGLEAPTRHPLDWQSEAFYEPAKCTAELERVFDICNGCRRCVNLCDSFPTLFDLIDNSASFDVEGVDKARFQDVVDQCYLCDLCYQTKCPYVPPHPWALDYPHLMLRAKAIRHRAEGTTFGERVLSSTTTVGKLATIPLVDTTVNALNRTAPVRKLLESALGVHHKARVPTYDRNTLRRRLRGHRPRDAAPQPAGPTRGRVALFGTCYGTYNTPQMGEDLVRVFEHNAIPVRLVEGEKCCGMPKLEQGDLESVAALKAHNIPLLAALVREGWDIVAPVPSCVLMFKQEIPLMFPGDADVQAVRAGIFDPFEYLMHRHKAGLLDTNFRHALGKVSYQAACHQRVQNIGPKTRDILALIPGTEVKAIERCSGHDGTYAVRTETHERAMRIVKPVVSQVQQFDPQTYTSDCPMAASHIAHGLGHDAQPPHPLTLLRRAYGI
jgi:glycerol-3-phosphate dehydrogenase subunit C